ncbi:hypothetical protein KIW84_010770 [Lathyrus oleraceus]|uniref:Reverse transcriptase n=1 Tax=Pisum sativum TaxID=3888 RepID=A0A9D4YKQ9_PEA|nr:hypothetical protein KIW84_010770 [Pisum sativum]
MKSITTVNMKVLWNGNECNAFETRKGIRQGDPISHYIFVLCMDMLAHMINGVVNKGDWKSLKAGRNGPMISHLRSDQQISKEKPKIHFSKNTLVHIKRQLSPSPGFRETRELRKYLGRVTLSKSFIEAIPTYFMMSKTLPKESLKGIQKVQRDFICGNSEAG